MMKALQAIRINVFLLVAGTVLCLSFLSLSIGGGVASAHALFSCSDNDVLCSGQTIPIGNYLISGNGRYQLKMQSDGNLVLYDLGENSRPIWASNTARTNATYAILQGDGNFVVYNNAGYAFWSSMTSGHQGDYLIVQNDGNAVIYYGSSAIWASRTAGQ